MSQTYVDMSYGSLYVSDLQNAIKWYYRAFGFRLLSINPSFATLQIAPGRIIFISTDPNSPRSIGFVSHNILALRRQLVQAQAVIEDNEGDMNTWFLVRDPDGNAIDVWTGGFGMEVMNHVVPDTLVPFTIWCSLESKDEMHIIARKISDQSEFNPLSDELISWCREQGIQTEGVAFTISKYSQQVDALYACIRLTEAPSRQLPDGAEYLHIPALDYAVFHKEYAYDPPYPPAEEIRMRTIHPLADNFRDAYQHRSNWMKGCFSKASSYYILEYYGEASIQSYFPYSWCRENG